MIFFTRGGIALVGGGGPAAGILSATPAVTVNASQSPYTVPAGVAAVRNDGSVSSPLTIILPSASVGSAVDGQLFIFNNFDTAMQLQTLQAAGPDNIEASSQHWISQYGALCVLKARVSGGVTNWSFFSINTRDTLSFPLMPALAASLTNVSLGGIIIPGGIKAVRSVWLVINGTLTAGTVSATLTGLSNVQTLTITSPSTAAGHLNAPANNNWKTVPGIAGASTPSGSIVTATLSTSAAFAGTATLAALGLDTY